MYKSKEHTQFHGGLSEALETWPQQEGACGVAAENKVTKGKFWPGSRWVQSHEFG